MDSVLIVDDNRAFAENLAEILDDAGVAADVVSEGAAALERMATTRYRLLISDMRMPIMSGAELVHRARRIDPTLAAMVVSAYTNDEDLIAVRREGLLAVLPKPAPVERLIELARTARRNGLVILVEDDAALAENLSEAFASRGFATMTAGSISETAQLGELVPLCALVDLSVPGGPDCAAMSPLRRKFPGLPMFIVTAQADAAPEEYVAIFRKPFDTGELLASIEEIHSAWHAS